MKTIKLAILTLIVSCVPLSAASSFYKVQSGDSLTTISLKLFGNAKKWKELAEWNHVDAPYHVKPGTRLEVKAGLLAKEKGEPLLVKYWNRKLSDGDRMTIARIRR
jgi:spore germination protein YaaH